MAVCVCMSGVYLFSPDGRESGLRLLSLHPAPRLMCSPSAVTGLPAGDRAWNLSGTLWNSVSFHHVNALFIRETVRVTNLCLFLFFILNISGWSVPSRFHPKQRMAAIDFYPLPKHCISFRLHERHNPSFRICLITLNSPPAFVELFCL